MENTEYPSTKNPSMIEIQELLGSSYVEEARDRFNEPRFKEWAANSPVDVIQSVSAFVTSKNQSLNPALVETCKWMLVTLVQDVPNPDEIFLELLDCMDTNKNDALLVAMLQCADVCLRRMDATKTRALDWCLSTLKDILENMPFNEVKRMEDLYDEIEKFYLNCIENLDKDKLKDCEEQKQCLATFLLSQLAHTDLPERTIISMIRALPEVLPHLGVPLTYLDEKGGWRKNKADTHHYLDEVSFSCSYEILYFYVIHRGICYDSFPQVFSPEFIFVRLGALCSQLLVNGDRDLQEKGLLLLTDVFERLDPGSITHHTLSSDHYSKLLQGLSNLMVHCDSLKLRKEAARIFKKFFHVFDERGRHLALLHGYRTLKDQGVRGYMVTISKDFVVEYLRSGNYFMKNLPVLLSRMFVLPENEEQMLYMYIDSVISKLNLLRYLLMVDPKPGSLTGIWEAEPDITERFLKPLPGALKFNREYLKEKMTDAELLKGNEPSEACVEVQGQVLPSPNYEEEVSGIKYSLTHLDFIDHVYEIVMEKLQGV